MQVQLWAPQGDANGLRQGLEQAHVQVRLCADPAAVRPELPLLLAYVEPLTLAVQPDSEPVAAAYQQLLGALPLLLQSHCHCRFVNLSALALPALVGWCVDPAASPASEALQPVGGLPSPTDALAAILALQWLEHHPEVLLAYQQLEAHPLAAALDQRPPDQACIQRYRQAASRQALLQLRQQHQDLQADLQELAAELAPRRLEQLQALDMQEQLQALWARLQRAEQAKARGKELEHSLLAQQADLEQLARRLALLEHLVAEGSDASLRLQHRLAQALA